MGNYQASTLQKSQIRQIYAIARKLNIQDSAIEQDELHALVFDLFHKTSIRELTYNQASQLIRRLQILQNATPSTKPVTSAMQKKAWALLYQLMSYDVEKSQATPGERMAGVAQSLGIEVQIVRREVQLQWLSQASLSKIIIRLGFLVNYEKKKRGATSG